MKIGNWHIIHDSELKRIREIDIRLKRKFSPEQIKAILDGTGHYSRNPKREKKAAA